MNPEFISEALRSIKEGLITLGNMDCVFTHYHLTTDNSSTKGAGLFIKNSSIQSVENYFLIGLNFGLVVAMGIRV